MQRIPGNVRRRDAFAGPPELARFFRGERLEAIPSKAPDRIAVLRYIATRFERDRVYEEGEVNRMLARAYDDFATLRRYLVDAGVVRRDHGRYVRAE
jgi:hypothetical protein